MAMTAAAADDTPVGVQKASSTDPVKEHKAAVNALSKAIKNHIKVTKDPHDGQVKGHTQTLDLLQRAYVGLKVAGKVYGSDL